jgi:trans-aconitate methyltransferase
VLSVDVDLRFHCDPVPGMEVRELDIVHDPLPRTGFDLIHARALLEHLAEREGVLDRLVEALRPGAGSSSRMATGAPSRHSRCPNRSPRS